jgi:hypothetical protein
MRAAFEAGPTSDFHVLVDFDARSVERRGVKMAAASPDVGASMGSATASPMGATPAEGPAVTAAEPAGREQPSASPAVAPPDVSEASGGAKPKAAWDLVPVREDAVSARDDRGAGAALADAAVVRLDRAGAGDGADRATVIEAPVVVSTGGLSAPDPRDEMNWASSSDVVAKGGRPAEPSRPVVPVRAEAGPRGPLAAAVARSEASRSAPGKAGDGSSSPVPSKVTATAADPAVAGAPDRDHERTSAAEPVGAAAVDAVDAGGDSPSPDGEGGQGETASKPVRREGAKTIAAEDIDAVVALLRAGDAPHLEQLVQLLDVVKRHATGQPLRLPEARQGWSAFADYARRYLGDIAGLEAEVDRIDALLQPPPAVAAQ